ncbi:MAG: phenylacetate--CoA ligase [Clostridia bacterium]|nr:phenylacetate--CoA ligase [Clostridia bacterium]
MIWNKQAECMSGDEKHALQSERLVRLVSYVYDRVPFYRAKMEKAGVLPGDIRGIDDITALPFTTKDDLRDNYPFGLFAVPHSDIVRIHASSGTTGKATVVGYTAADLDKWAECVARCLTMAGVTRDDIIQIAYGYGLFTGGLGAHGGAERVGAMVVPMSTGNSKKLTTMMVDFGATAIACTPSYLLHISEVLRAEGLLDRVKLRTAICGAEPWTEKMRREIEGSLGITAHDIYGLSEIMGPGVACDCVHHTGLHVCDDHFYPEVLDTATLTPVAAGTTGELAFTTLTKEGIPLIRYRTKDITRLIYEPCRCGRTTCRMENLSGRSDDMLKIRGVNVFPGQIEEVILSVPELGPHYEIIVEREGYSDKLAIRVELVAATDSFPELERIKATVSSRLRTVLGLDARVLLESPNTLQRFEGKAKRIKDLRSKK